MIFIYYPKCTTCLKAKKWLDEHNIEYTERHMKENNPSIDELKTWHKQSGLPLKKFFNTSGLLYKSLNLKEKLPNMSDDEIYSILASDGMLVKRPLVIMQDKILIGFKEKEWEENLL
ncbi:MAG: arsenate reductase family protein [Treponema sp.]